MAQAKEPGPVVFLTGILAADENCLAQALELIRQRWGEPCWQSDLFAFTNSGYYEDEAGSNIIKAFLGYDSRFDREQLIERKLQANEMETRLAEICDNGLSRPLNIDPGYLAPEKLVLASCKNFAHRIYLSRGVFAEVTLLYQKGDFRALEWTFPDFAAKSYWPFLKQLRNYMMQEWYNPKKNGCN